MAKKVDYSVEDKLRALYDLQLVDSRIDKLRSVRGELPLEVQDLEDEVSGLEEIVGRRDEPAVEASRPTHYVRLLQQPEDGAVEARLLRGARDREASFRMHEC